MRFESKNKEIVNYAHTISSRKNLSFSLAKKCCFKFTNVILNYTTEPTFTFTLSKNSSKPLYNFEEMFEEIIGFPEYGESIVFKNTLYRLNDYLYYDDDLYNIADIVKISECVYFILQKIEISTRDQHYMCYYINKYTTFYEKINIANLECKPLQKFRLPNGKTAFKPNML